MTIPFWAFDNTHAGDVMEIDKDQAARGTPTTIARSVRFWNPQTSVVQDSVSYLTVLLRPKSLDLRLTFDHWDLRTHCSERWLCPWLVTGPLLPKA